TARLMPDEIGPCLAGESSEHLWMHFALSDHRARHFIEGLSMAPAAARALVLGNDRRLQINVSGSWAFGVLPDIARDFENRMLGVGRVNFAMNDRVLLTARHHPMRAVDELRDAVQASEEVSDPASLVVGLVQTFIGLIETRLLNIISELDHIEDVVLSDAD